jgi:hypothetical protein
MQRRDIRALFFGAAIAATLGLSQAAIASGNRFTIAVIPDTQNYVDYQHQKTEGFPFDARPMFIEQMQFVADHAESAGGEIAFVTALGDVWQHQSLDIDPGHAARGFTFQTIVSKYFGPKAETRSVEMPSAAEGYDLIAGKVPFSVVPGNHDYDAMWIKPRPAGADGKPIGPLLVHVGGLGNFTSVFGSGSHYFKGQPWYVAAHDDGADSAQIFTAGGYRFLHIGLQFDPPDTSLAWADAVMRKYPGLPTILTTHDYMNKDAQRLPALPTDSQALDRQDNDPEAIWQKLIRSHRQIFMVLAGHQSGQALRVDRNRAGGAVYQLLADYQDRGQVLKDAGLTLGPLLGMGDGWMRLMAFDMGGKTPTVHVRTWSTHYRSFSSDWPNYAAWYKADEKPQLSDEAFRREDDFTLSLSDFRARFDKRARLRAAGRR